MVGFRSAVHSPPKVAPGLSLRDCDRGTGNGSTTGLQFILPDWTATALNTGHPPIVMSVRGDYTDV